MLDRNSSTEFLLKAIWLCQLQKEKNGRLSKFASYVQSFGAGLETEIGNVESGTIFAPNNDAFDRLSKSQLEALLGSAAGPRILGLHFIDQRIPAEDVRILQPQNKIKVHTCPIFFPIFISPTNEPIFVILRSTI